MKNTLRIIVEWILILAFAVLFWGTIGGIFYGLYLIVKILLSCGG